MINSIIKTLKFLFTDEDLQISDVFIFRFPGNEHLFISKFCGFCSSDSVPVIKKLNKKMRNKNNELHGEVDQFIVFKNVKVVKRENDDVKLYSVKPIDFHLYDLNHCFTNVLRGKNEFLIFPFDSLSFIGEPGDELIKKYYENDNINENNET